MKTHDSLVGPRQQRGAVLILFGLSLVVLIGFAGLAIDLGRFFVIKSELQNAMDACALSAASQLRPGQHDTNALTRAVAYGRVFTTGGEKGITTILNKANFQSSPVNIADSDVTFFENLNDESPTIDPNKAKYAKCDYPLSGLPIYFMRVLNLRFDTNYDTQTVRAKAMATVGPQTCNVIPVGICPPSTGLQVGDWLKVGTPEDHAEGWFRWVHFEGTALGANGVRDGITSEGFCDIPSVDDWGDKQIQQGNIADALHAWNTRFGIYQAAFDKDSPSPDITGYAYFNDENKVGTDWAAWTNWKVNDGTSDLSGPPTVSQPYSDTGPVILPGRAYPHYKKVAQANNLTYEDSFALIIPELDSKDKPKITANPKPIIKASYISDGNTDRRLVIVPTMQNCESTSDKPVIKGLACTLMLNPSTSDTKLKLEYLGPIGASSPCGSGTVVTPNMSVLVK